MQARMSALRQPPARAEPEQPRAFVSRRVLQQLADSLQNEVRITHVVSGKTKVRQGSAKAYRE